MNKKCKASRARAGRNDPVTGLYQDIYSYIEGISDTHRPKTMLSFMISFVFFLNILYSDDDIVNVASMGNNA